MDWVELIVSERGNLTPLTLFPYKEGGTEKIIFLPPRKEGEQLIGEREFWGEKN